MNKMFFVNSHIFILNSLHVSHFAHNTSLGREWFHGHVPYCGERERNGEKEIREAFRSLQLIA